MAHLSPRVLPWADWQDWQEASELLFSTDLAARESGVARVKAWRSRGRVPVAVDATASLIEVSLTDLQGGRASEHELQLLYGIVITRAINGLVDSKQTKFYAEPVNVLGHRMGLPVWLIDLRHETTHGALPALASLRCGAQQLLDWLYQQYWHKQASDLAACSAAGLRLLRAYKRIADKAQAETPQALVRAYREASASQSGGNTNGNSSNSNDLLLCETLESFRATLSPTFITHFLVPLLVTTTTTTQHQDGDGGAAAAVDAAPPSSFLPSDEAHLSSSSSPSCHHQQDVELARFRQRQLLAPLLVALERAYPAFSSSLLTRLVEHEGQGQGRQHWSFWISYLLSRDWHSHFPKGRQLADFHLLRGGGIRFNLRDKSPDKWTPAEAAFMARPAPRRFQLHEGRLLDALVSRFGSAPWASQLVTMLQSPPTGNEEEGGGGQVVVVGQKRTHQHMLGLKELQKLAGFKQQPPEAGEVESPAATPAASE